MGEPNKHDDGYYPNYYGVHDKDEDRLAASQELLYSALEDERALLLAAGSDVPEDGGGILYFKDPDFIAGAKSLYRNPYQPPRGALPSEMVEWNRLGAREVEGCANPVLFGTGVPGVDAEPTGLVVQGALRNCWFIGACAALATKPNLLKALFVSDPIQFGSKGVFGGTWMGVGVD